MICPLQIVWLPLWVAGIICCVVGIPFTSAITAEWDKLLANETIANAARAARLVVIKRIWEGCFSTMLILSDVWPDYLLRAVGLRDTGDGVGAWVLAPRTLEAATKSALVRGALVSRF